MQADRPRFLEELNRRKPDSMRAFAAIWYRCNSGLTDWRRCAGHRYDGFCYHLLNLHAAFSTERPAHAIEFRAFNGSLNPQKIQAYIQLCMAIIAQALTSKAASPTRPETDNPKYTFRCWLLRLGFIGSEFATARKEFIRLLPGNSAWRLRAETGTAGRGKPHTFSQIEEAHIMRNLTENRYWNSEGEVQALYDEMEAAGFKYTKATETFFHSNYRYYTTATCPAGRGAAGRSPGTATATAAHSVCSPRPARKNSSTAPPRGSKSSTAASAR